jgi:MoaA/NifB/PqqE/SkfB family radical SAM enzyme
MFKKWFRWMRGRRQEYGLNRQSPVDKIKRHLGTFVRHGTFKKFVNLFLVMLQALLRRTTIRGYPFFIKLEPTSRCNLKCRGCIHSTDFPIRYGDMPIELYQRIVDELGDYLFNISMYIIGEPLLYPKIYDMVEYAARRNIGTVISTNLHAFNEERAERMINSGLSHLIVALDAMDQGIYEQMRVNGNLEKVRTNLQILVKKKQERRSSMPFLEVQTIRNDLTREEIPKIARFLESLGVDRHTIKDDANEFTMFTGQHKPCYWLWNTVLINEEGLVLPCCPTACTPEFMASELREFGNLNEIDVKQIWNTPRYQDARKVFAFRRSRVKEIDKNHVPICLTCAIFRGKERIEADLDICGLKDIPIFGLCE